MKLRQLLKAHFDTNGPTPMGRGIFDYILTPKLLKLYEDEIKRCIEFNNSRVEIIEEIKSGKPQKVLVGHDEDGIPIYEMKLSTVSMDNEPIVTTKIGENTKFAPVVKLYSISLGPEIFDPSDIFKTKVDTVWLTPSIYDPESMTPTKRMVITFSPEVAQDLAVKELRKEIKEREKDEEKPEFTVIIDEENKDKKEKIIKEQEQDAQNLMGSINQDELKNKIHEKENGLLQKMLEMVQECFNNPSHYVLPSKRPILIRVTQDSLLTNDKPTIHPSDTTVTLGNK